MRRGRDLKEVMGEVRRCKAAWGRKKKAEGKRGRPEGKSGRARIKLKGRAKKKRYMSKEE
jgi:hypothetical protein